MADTTFPDDGNDVVMPNAIPDHLVFSCCIVLWVL
jgi:hypothetical protein